MLAQAGIHPASRMDARLHGHDRLESERTTVPRKKSKQLLKELYLTADLFLLSSPFLWLHSDRLLDNDRDAARQHATFRQIVLET